MIAAILLADEGFTGFHGAKLLILIAGGVAAFLWMIVFAWRWIASRPKMPDAGPETQELGTEPPAIANLLVNRWNVTKVAAQATLVDLAARKVVGIDQYGTDHFMVRLRDIPPDEKISPYEKQVLDLVRKRATGGAAPVEALNLGEEGEAQAWWKRFSNSVEGDARARGLARNRWAPEDWVILGAGLVIVFGLFALAFALAHVGGTKSTGEREITPEGWLGIAAGAWLFSMAALRSLRNLRDTPAGRKVCAQWLGIRNYLRNSHAFDDAPVSAVTVWERYMAYGLAMGVARDAAHELPLAADDPNTAWTRYSGTWRQIRVDYPEHFGYGESPFGVFAGGIGRTILWGGIGFVFLPIVADVGWRVASDGIGDTNDNRLLLLGAGFVVAFMAMGIYVAFNLINGLIRLFYGGSDLFGKPVVIEGEVVKSHAGRIAVDDGHVEEVRAWTPPAGGQHPNVGAHIRATMSKHLHHVTLVETVPDRPAATPGDAKPQPA